MREHGLPAITGSRGISHLIDINKRENFYQQEYCGCVYSLLEEAMGVVALRHDVTRVPFGH
jgi:predicted adenine nucleotide alpha hydrolase (AANH) superfamily ATPase